MDKRGLIQVFNKTMSICRDDEELKSAIKESIQNQTVIFESDTVDDRVDYDSTSTVTQYLSGDRSFEAARQYVKEGKKVCVLNFASFVTPGGGVKKGSRAQEESLCRISTLYPALISNTAAPFYKSHHDQIENKTSSRKNNDDCIYTPGVKVICEDHEDFNMLPKSEWYTVDVITCAAPDQRYADFGRFNPSDDELYDVMVKRIGRIYAIAAHYHADVLIMGAFGCGVFYNSPEVVAKAFETVTEKYKNAFECVEYAIASKRRNSENYLAFKNNINGIIERADKR